MISIQYPRFFRFGAIVMGRSFFFCLEESCDIFRVKSSAIQNCSIPVLLAAPNSYRFANTGVGWTFTL
jgi:hypothetical protein